jgi:hypothetical protein
VNTYFDDNRCRVAVDHTTPVDVLEPEVESSRADSHDLLTVTERVAATYLTGNPALTRIAWRVLLNKEPESIRACARRAGCSPAAISKRVMILSEQFNVPLRNPHIRAMRSRITRDSWRKRKRREDRNPPAANDDQSKTNDRAEVKGGRP